MRKSFLSARVCFTDYKIRTKKGLLPIKRQRPMLIIKAKFCIGENYTSSAKKKMQKMPPVKKTSPVFSVFLSKKGCL